MFPLAICLHLEKKKKTHPSRKKKKKGSWNVTSLFWGPGLQVLVLSDKNPQISKAFHGEAFSQREMLPRTAELYAWISLRVSRRTILWKKIWIGVVCQCY